jgi:hypothetical protein
MAAGMAALGLAALDFAATLLAAAAGLGFRAVQRKAENSDGDCSQRQQFT